MIKRRKTRKLRIGKVAIGGDAPISIQSMTKTDTKAVNATLGRIKRLKKAGCDIVRVAVSDRGAIAPLKKIIERSDIPVVADIHFLPQLALDAIEAGSAAIRLNPGNIKRTEDIKRIIGSAKKKGIPVRIGVNSGSLSQRCGSVADSMVKSALDYIKIFEKDGFRDIIISLKSSDVSETVEAYRKMASLCDYPFHLGVTAAGPFLTSAVKSSVGIGTLLQEGIGDTVRVSVTGDSLTEVEIAKEILSSLKLRNFGPEIISCPTCGRCGIDLEGAVSEFKERLKDTRLANIKFPFKIAIMGCVVNGPGEAKDADIGIAGGKDKGALFKKGKKVKDLKEGEFIDALIGELRKYK
jgi:(E)-4-hydroxy-3-methylbut-2-enyl-diphosphate synthase